MQLCRKLNINNHDESNSKRFKTGENIKSLQFDKLPAKFIEKLFEKLDIDDLRSIRLTDKTLKDLIDNCNFVWKELLNVNFKVKNSIDIQGLIETLKKWKYLHDVNIESDKCLKFDCNNYNSFDNPYSNGSLSQSVCVELIEYRLEMNLLANLFKTTCDSLYITSMSSRNLANVDTQTVQLDLPKLKKLFINCGTCISMNCLKKESEDNSNDEGGSQMMSSLINNCIISRKNIQQLNIVNYFGPLGILQNCLKDFELGCLWILSCKSDDKIDENWSYNYKIKVKSLLIKSSMNILDLILFHTIDLSSLHILSIGDNLYNDNRKFPDIDNIKLKQLFFKRLSGKLTNLQVLSYDDDLSFLQKFNVQLPDTLAEVEFLQETEVDLMIKFVCTYLHQFQSLETMSFKVCLDCCDRTFDSTEMEIILKGMLQFIRQNFANFKELNLNGICVSCIFSENQEYCSLNSYVSIGPDDIDNFSYQTFLKR